MSVVKVIEVLSESSTSWEDATKTAVSKVSKTVKGIKSVWVKDMSTTIKDDQVDKFRVSLKVSFEVK